MKLFGPSLLSLIVLLVGTPVDSLVTAQEKRLREEDRATIYFEANLANLMNSDFVKKIGLDTLLEKMMMTENTLGFDPRTATKVVGTLKLPDHPSSLMAFGMNVEPPMHGICHLQFSNDSGPAVLEKELKQFSETLEIDGKTYYSPGGGLLFHFADNSLLIGTENYVRNIDQDQTTPRLRAAIEQLPADHAVKLGIDVQGCRKFLDGFYEMNESDLWTFLPNPNILPLMKFYKDLDEVVISGDLGQEHILTLIANSPNEQTAKKTNATVSQLFNMAKQGGRMGLAELEFLKKEDVKTLTNLLDQLNLTRKGNVNTAKIVTPDGFSKLAASLSAEMQRQAATTQKRRYFSQIGAAVYDFHDAYGKMPFGDLKDARWNKDLSWRTRVCRYFSEMDKPLVINLDEPWDSDANRKNAEKMPGHFGSDGKNASICWIKSSVRGFGDITDGSSNTVMLIENPNPVPWMQPKDLSVLEAINMVKNLEVGEKLSVVMYDSSVQFIDNSFSHNELKSLFTPGGNEPPVELWNRGRSGEVEPEIEQIDIDN